MSYLEGIEYIKPEGTTPTKLVAAAVLQDGKVWTGERHWTLIHKAHKVSGRMVRSDEQGFWTDDDRFVMRKAGMALALRNGQVERENLISKRTLMSEDLW